MPLFWSESSNLCVSKCSNGYFADNSTMKCVAKCPVQPDFYGYNDTNLGPICVLFCPPNFYKHVPTRTC